jgi:hypothetical protein
MSPVAVFCHLAILLAIRLIGGHKTGFHASRGVAIFRFEHVPVDAHRDLDVRVPGAPRELLAEQDRAKKILGRDYDDHGLVFCQANVSSVSGAGGVASCAALRLIRPHFRARVNAELSTR